MSDDLADELPTAYAIRFSQKAFVQMQEERKRIAEIAGDDMADAWREGLLQAVARLSSYPERVAVAREDYLFPAGILRVLLYQRRRGGPTWRILFSVHEATVDDPAFIRVQRIQPAAQAPLTDLLVEDA